MDRLTITGLESYSITELESLVYAHIDFLRENYELEGLDFTIIRIQFFGSRVHGRPRMRSDLDVKVEYLGDAREDDVFNALNAKRNRMYIDGLRVDFFPERVAEEEQIGQRGSLFRPSY